MMLKLFVQNIFLVSLAFGENYGISKENGFADDVCGYRNSAHFARNTRGCSWFWFCNEQNEAVSEDRCPENYRFNYDGQVCDFAENVECDFDDRPIEYECPRNALVTYIPHPMSC